MSVAAAAPAFRSFDPAEAADLRRRRKAEQIDQVLARSDSLPESDRLLLHAVFRDGRTAVELGALTGRSARLIRRRVKALVRRVASAPYVFVLRHMGVWTTQRRRVATACVIHGLSQRRAARELNLSLHTVRRQCGAIRALFDAPAQGRA